MSEHPHQDIAKVRVGKIANKYLILDIIAKAYHTIDEVIYRMFYGDKKLRNLLIEQLKYLKARNKHRLQTLNLNFYKDKEDNILKLKPFNFILTNHNLMNKCFHLNIYLPNI